MKITYLAASSCIIEHAGVRVLCDPWLFGPAYYGSWHHNPPLNLKPEDLGKIDYIYISHIHHDHCHIETLKQLPKIPLLIAPYVERYLYTMLHGRGFPVHECPINTRIALGPNFAVEVVAADACNPELCGQHWGCPVPLTHRDRTWQIDSLAVFSATVGDKTQVVVNANDCPHMVGAPACHRIRDAYPHVDVLLINPTLAGAWPQTHDMPKGRKVRNAALKFDWGLKNASAYGESLKPKWSIPLGDFYTLGGRLVDLNPFRGIVEVEDLHGETIVKMNRGATFDVRTGQCDQAYVPKDFAAMEAYAETLRDIPFDYDSDPEPKDLDALMDKAQKAFWERCKERSIGALPWDVTFKSGDQSWVITTNPDVKAFGHMTVTVDPKLLRRLLVQKARWHVAEIGSHLKFQREPDEFYGALYRAMNYFHV